MWLTNSKLHHMLNLWQGGGGQINCFSPVNPKIHRYMSLMNYIKVALYTGRDLSTGAGGQIWHFRRLGQLNYSVLLAWRHQCL